MNFTNWITWFLSYFKKEDVSKKEEDVSEFVNSKSVHGSYKTVESVNPHDELVFQQIPDADLFSENVKFKELLEKIHKYAILGESEYNYIQNLPREKKEYLINILNK